MKWKDVSVFKFQELEKIGARTDIDLFEKSLLSVCIAFGLTPEELNNKGIKRVNTLIAKLEKVFVKPFDPQAPKRIGRYFLNYDPAKMTFGQYVELAYFLQYPMKNAHYVLATISRKMIMKNHPRRAEYFLGKRVDQVYGAMMLLRERFSRFNQEYSTLFGLSENASAAEDFFNRRYGWTYSATMVAAHEGITLDKTFLLPVRQALGDLAYLKAKGIYEAEQIKKK